MFKRLNNYSEKLLRYGVAALILAVPLYPKFPFISVPGTYVSIRLEDFVIFLVSVLWFSSFFPNMGRLVKGRIDRSILLFLAVGLLSVASGVLVTSTIAPHLGLLHWLRRVEYLGCFFIGASAIKKREDLTFYIKCFILVIIYVFVFGIGQKYFSWPVITTQNNEYAKGVALRYVQGGHLVTTFAGHYDLASFIVLITPLLFVLLTSKKALLQDFKMNINVFRAVLLVVITFSLWLLVNTASRISIASFFVSVVFALVLVRRYLFIPLVLAITLIFVSMSSSLMQRYFQVFDVYIQKVINTGKTSLNFPGLVYAQEDEGPKRQPEKSAAPQAAPVFEDRSTSIRLNVEWPRALRAFRKNPLLGTGYSSITLATDNDFLRLLGEVGLVGLLSFLLIFYKIGLLFLRSFKKLFPLNLESLFVLSVMSTLPGIFLNAVFIDIFEASKFAILFWLMLGFAVSQAIKFEK